MTLRRKLALAAALVAAALLAAVEYVAHDPDVLVRAEFARQLHAAGLSKHARDVAGHRWVYAERAGAAPDAPTLVFVHGFTGSKENFYPLARALEESGARYRIVIPDLPGWGESERLPRENYGFLAQSERVAAFIRSISPDRPVVLVGQSIGGGIFTHTAPVTAATAAALTASRPACALTVSGYASRQWWTVCRRSSRSVKQSRR
jgi:alpha-beta hydrolase superfamily lysophospholipase